VSTGLSKMAPPVTGQRGCLTWNLRCGYIYFLFIFIFNFYIYI